jgi:hypothetical protein
MSRVGRGISKKCDFGMSWSLTELSGVAISTAKTVGVFLLGFFSNLLMPHIKRQFEEYNATLVEISRTLHNSGALIFTWEFKEKEAEHLQLYEKVRELRARLLASTTTIPKPVLLAFRALYLVRPQKKIDEGAMMLIGLSNNVLSQQKDRPHLRELVQRLGQALGISVGE